MYQPSHHRQDRLEAQHGLIRAYPLGTLVTVGPDSILANPVPFLLDVAASPKGVLKAHVARANPLWRAHDPAREALVIFQGPQCYVSPSFYASKAETGKVVPTWNYVTVQVHGRLKVIEERAWLLDQIRALTALQEAGQPVPWTIDDAPTDFISAMLAAIVGIEIDIDRIEGKWKLSQNRSPGDQRSLVEALRRSSQESARAIAALIADGSRGPTAAPIE
jgi:transcriptional regulator